MTGGAAGPTALANTHAAALVTERPWTATEFQILLGQPTTLLAGDARAFVLGRVILDEAEVLTLATHPAHRRQGLARAALATFLCAAHARGATRAFLDVAEDNLAARALYAGAGFAEIGRRDGYYPALGAGNAKSRTTALLLAREIGDTPDDG
jgi:ribosomal-protein-alanine N-acetyltransferase